jgi:hypothetical protein
MLRETNKTTNRSKRKQRQSQNASLAAGAVTKATPPQRPSVLPAGKALSAKPLTAKEFRAELKAQQVQRLLAQVDQQAEELVNEMMSQPQALPANTTPQRG